MLAAKFCRYRGSPRWRVNAVLNGKRTQRYFKTRDEAEQWICDINSNSCTQNFWASLPHRDKLELISAHQIAQKRSINLLEAALQFRPFESALPIKLTQVIDKYLAKKADESLRALSLKQIRWKLSLLTRAFPNESPNNLTPSHLEAWFTARNWSRSTIDGVIAKIGPFFNWCVREGYCKTNPCEAVKRPRSEDKPPSIFRPHEAQKLLQLALKKEPSLIPYLAIGLFAGIRPAEIERLTRKDILEDYIEVSAAKAKTRQRRLVKISPNLKEWLAIRPLGVIRNKRKRLNRILKLTQLTWQPDIMRHSFASYHLAYHCSADKTAHELGHRDTGMLYRHYRQLVKREDAEVFWAVKPNH